MRLLTKLACASVVTAGSGAAGVLYYQRASKSSREAAANKPKELSAKEFNALQDAGFLQRALSAQHLPWTYPSLKERYGNLTELLTQHNETARSVDEPSTPRQSDAASYTPSPSDVKIVFYRLLGCPYCAKVESVLQYHNIPYAEVWVDPITGDGLPDCRYALAPQLLFTPLTSSTASGADQQCPGAYVVDSAAIAAALAQPLHYTADLANKHITETRDWITNHFHGASFAITNSTFRNAYDTYTYVTPSKYQNFLYRIVGSGALSALSRFKIQPKLIAKMEATGPVLVTPSPPPPASADGVAAAAAAATEPHSASMAESTGLWMLPEESRRALAATMRAGDAEAWLRAELQVFLSRRPAGSVFHGGKKPDLADVEMYGVSRVVDQHPRLGHVVREGDFGAWQTAMQARFKEATGTVYA